MKRRAFLTAVALVAALGTASLASARPAGPAARAVVTVSMYEMGFKLSKRTVPKGVVLFRVVNSGDVDHDFRIKGRGTPMLAPGRRAALKMRFPKAGRYTFVCTAQGHAAAGMVGKLIVE